MFFLSVCFSLLTDRDGGHSLSSQGKQNTGEPILGPSCLLRLSYPESQGGLLDQMDGAKLSFTWYDGGHRQKDIWHTITAHTLSQISAFHVTVIQWHCHFYVAHKFVKTQIVDKARHTTKYYRSKRMFVKCWFVLMCSNSRECWSEFQIAELKIVQAMLICCTVQLWGHVTDWWD